MITRLLATVPRQMLLIFKTNDLLRAIETNLGKCSRDSAWNTHGKARYRVFHECSERHTFGGAQSIQNKPQIGMKYWTQHSYNSKYCTLWYAGPAVSNRVAYNL